MTAVVMDGLFAMLRTCLKIFAVMIGVVALVFFLIRFAPGDPLSSVLGEGTDAATVETVRSELGLNDPVLMQFARYVGNIATGDLGTSLVHRRPALDPVLEALPNTLLLAVTAFILSLLIAIPAGVVSAVWRGSLIDKAIQTFVVLTQAMPPFWVAILLINFMAVRWGLLPTSGIGSWKHLVLPALTLSLLQIAMSVRTLRSALLEVFKEDYIRTARAKGMRKWTVVLRHGLTNAMAPILMVLGLQFGTMLSGAVITEAVFAWPGLGSLGLNALLTRDYAVAQAVVMATALLVVLANVLADFVVAMLDPRIRSRLARGRR